MRMGNLRDFFSSPKKADLGKELRVRKMLAQEMFGVDVDVAKEEENLRAAHDVVGTCVIQMGEVFTLLQGKGKRILNTAAGTCRLQMPETACCI